jgi:hypothetical protein
LLSGDFSLNQRASAHHSGPAESTLGDAISDALKLRDPAHPRYGEAQFSLYFRAVPCFSRAHRRSARHSDRVSSE